MRKQLQFLYRYFTTTRRWRRWINFQTLMILGMAAIVFAAVAATASTAAPATTAGSTQAAATPIPTASLIAGETEEAATVEAAETHQVLSTPTRTPLPPEYINNANQTLGIAFIGAFLVLVVVMGVALFMPRENHE